MASTVGPVEARLGQQWRLMRPFAFTSTRRGFAAVIAAVVLGVLVGRASGSPVASFVPYATGFSSPVYVTSAPGDPVTLFVVEQAGTIKIVKTGPSRGRSSTSTRS